MAEHIGAADFPARSNAKRDGPQGWAADEPGEEKMIYIAVCDDDPAQLEYVKARVGEWTAAGPPAQVSGFPSAEAFLFAQAEGRHWDILLLDVQMGGMDGITLARKVRADNKEAQIIFITSYMEYIADGYEVEALHYLIKPVTGPKLNTVLDRAVEKLRRAERALFIQKPGEWARVPLYEVRCLEVRRNYVTVHAGAEHTVKKTLAELEKELDETFYRAGRSYIVNLRHVCRITKTEAVLTGGLTVPLPRGVYAELNRALIERL